jgi:hypothetical protein
MATSRSNLPKEMMPLSSTPTRKPPVSQPETGTFRNLKAPPFGKAPVAPKGNPFVKKAPAFARGGSVPEPMTNPTRVIKDQVAVTPKVESIARDYKVKPEGAGIMRGTGAATKGKKFSGVY